MKILFLCSGDLKEEFSAASWVQSILSDLALQKGISLFIYFPKYGAKKKTVIVKGGVTYCQFPHTKSIYRVDKTAERFLQNEIEKISPSIIHVCGTEYPYALEVVNAAEKAGYLNKVLLVIQGLCSKIADHYCDGLPFHMIHGTTIRDFLKRDNVFWQRRKMFRRGKNELTAIKKVSHISGRTEWDKACTYFINPEATYYHCNEFLRTSFYDCKWEVKNCERHSIFISQYYYTIKGMHVLLDAVKLLTAEFPDIKIYTTGRQIPAKPFNIRESGYFRCLRKLIKKNGLQDKVISCGRLSEEEMCSQYLKANVFVSPSLIENSSNSIGEAMLVGCPVVSSYVGGVANFIKHDQNGLLHQSNAPYMLAHYIRKIFLDDDYAERLSNSARESAVQIFDRKNTIEELLRIYATISS